MIGKITKTKVYLNNNSHTPLFRYKDYINTKLVKNVDGSLIS